MTNQRLSLLVRLALALAMLASCDDGEDEDESESENLKPCPDAAVGEQTAALEAACKLDAGPFSLTIDNPWFPLPVGSLRVLEGEEDGAAIRVEIRVLDETENVAGVTTRVIEEREEEDGELVEISRNFFAQNADGSVCYFGEEVDIYEDGEIIDHEGAWRAGDGDAQPGVVMPAEPTLGMSYAQETAPDAGAWDHASHVAEGETISVPAGEYTDTIRTIEWTPIEPDDLSKKAYARGVGMIIDSVATLTSYEP